MCNLTMEQNNKSEFDLACDLVDNASGLLAVAEELFGDLSAISEAIAAATAGGSLARRLADYSARTAEQEIYRFRQYKEEYNGHANRFAKARFGGNSSYGPAEEKKANEPASNDEARHDD